MWAKRGTSEYDLFQNIRTLRNSRGAIFNLEFTIESNK